MALFVVIEYLKELRERDDLKCCWWQHACEVGSLLEDAGVFSDEGSSIRSPPPLKDARVGCVLIGRSVTLHGQRDPSSFSLLLGVQAWPQIEDAGHDRGLNGNRRLGMGRFLAHAAGCNDIDLALLDEGLEARDQAVAVGPVAVERVCIDCDVGSTRINRPAAIFLKACSGSKACDPLAGCEYPIVMDAKELVDTVHHADLVWRTDEVCKWHRNHRHRLDRGVPHHAGNNV